MRLASTKYGRPSVTLYDEMRVYEEYGVEPKELIEVKALTGPTHHDCIPGVRGIGPKGAGELIQKYHSIDYIYDHLHELDLKPAMRKRLEEGKDSAYLSRASSAQSSKTRPSTPPLPIMSSSRRSARRPRRF